MLTRYLTKIAGTAFMLSSLVCIVPAQAQSIDNAPNDLALAAKVKTELLKTTPFQDPEVDLSVSSFNGHVNLAGWVTYANDPQIAADIAASVSGVKDVTTNLHTWSSDRDFRF